jgi:oligopeptide transport system substrate-binding protein
MCGWKSSVRLLLAALIAALSGCSPREEKVQPPQVLRLSQRNEPADLDPARTTLADEFSILRALLEGLLIPGENGGPPQPGAATRWEVSADGLTYTFHLRPDARWSDGVPVTAAHFQAAYRRLLDPTTAAPKAGLFFAVKGARAFATSALTDFSGVGFRAPDPHRLVIELESPSPRFPYTVASGPWLPVRTDIIERHGRAWTRPANFVGNGPFLLAEWRADQRIVARRNPSWHGVAGVRLDEVHFVRFDSGDSEERAYRAGQVEATMAVPVSKIPVYRQERPAELHRQPMIETRYLAFNTRRPPLDDPRVRRALALALDRPLLTERVLQGGQVPAGRLVPPALRRAGEPDLPSEHRHDPAAARRLLAAAGVEARNFPRMELSCWSSPAIVEAVQAMWRRELGLQVALVQREARVHLDALATGAYDIALVAAIPDIADPADLLSHFLSRAPENHPGWSDPAFDAALRAGDTAAAENRLLEDAPLSPLYFNTKVWLMSPRVRGWQEDGLWTRCYQQVSLAAP